MIGAVEVHTNDELIQSELVTVDFSPGAFEPLLFKGHFLCWLLEGKLVSCGVVMDIDAFC